MTPRDKAQSAHLSGGSDAKRNFILQQALGEPAARTCALQYSALLFPRRLVGLWIFVAAILQAPLLFFALAAVLWWSALVPRLNPFDTLHNWTFARSSGITLTSAPAPRKFAQFLAGSFAIAIGLSLALGWRLAALVLGGVFMVAVGALLVGGFCFVCFALYLLRVRADFARRTLPWVTGA